jgi:hypothetical protein
MAGKTQDLRSIAPKIMADFNKLKSQLDLKSLDLVQITRILNDHQHTVIKYALIIGSLFAAGVMFNDHRTKEQGIRAQMTAVQEKIDAIKARDASIKDISTFQSSLPKKLNEFELITLISGYAKSYHVNIPSLSPAESQDMGLYDVIIVKFDAMSDNFKDMVLFLRKIEKSEFPLKIDAWSGSQDQNGNITFTITISAVLIHT